MSEGKLEQFKLTAYTRSIPKTMLEKICQDLELSIKLISFYDKDRRENRDNLTMRCDIYNKEEYNKGVPEKKTKKQTSEDTGEEKYDGTGEVYNLGLIHDHYFLIDTAEVTEYALKHYEQVKHVKDCHRIRAWVEKEKKYKKELTNPRYISSSRVVYLLFENDLVEPMELDESIMYTQYYDKVCDFSDLTYNEKVC